MKRKDCNLLILVHDDDIPLLYKKPMRFDYKFPEDAEKQHLYADIVLDKPFLQTPYHS